MAEPTLTAAAVTAAISTATLALFGVDYYSLLYGFVGALLAVSQADHSGRIRAITTVFFSTIVGAVFGNAALALFGASSRPLLILGCLIGGYGALVLVQSIMRAALARIENLGGQRHE